MASRKLILLSNSKMIAKQRTKEHYVIERPKEGTFFLAGVGLVVDVEKKETFVKRLISQGRNSPFAWDSVSWSHCRQIVGSLPQSVHSTSVSLLHRKG